jgi:probable HAF family extracellular repeat protein
MTSESSVFHRQQGLEVKRLFFASGRGTSILLDIPLYRSIQGVADLGTLGGPDTDFDEYCSNANAINDGDQIVGWSTTMPSTFEPCANADSNAPHAFVWSKQKGMQDLGTLPGDSMSMAYGNSFFGQVIGNSGNSVIGLPYHGIL